MSISILAGTHLCQGSCTAMLQSGTAPRNRIPRREGWDLWFLGPASASPLFQEEVVRQFLLCLFLITKPPDGHCHGMRAHSSCQPSEDHSELHEQHNGDEIQEKKKNLYAFFHFQVRNTHNLSDFTSAPPQAAIRDGPSCANCSNHACKQNANAVTFAGEILRITWRVEENRASKWRKQECQAMTCLVSTTQRNWPHLIKREGTGEWENKEPLAHHILLKVPGIMLILSTFKANSCQPITTDTFEHQSCLK